MKCQTRHRVNRHPVEDFAEKRLFVIKPVQTLHCLYGSRRDGVRSTRRPRGRQQAHHAIDYHVERQSLQIPRQMFRHSCTAQTPPSVVFARRQRGHAHDGHVTHVVNTPNTRTTCNDVLSENSAHPCVWVLPATPPFDCSICFVGISVCALCGRVRFF